MDIKHVWLGRYISFHDNVGMSDVARALNQALHDEIADDAGNIGFAGFVVRSGAC